MLVIMSLGPAPPPGHAMPADDSVEQLQFVCELLISRGELVIVPGSQHSPPQPSCLGGRVQIRRLPIGLPPQTLQGYSDGCGMTGVNVLLGQVDMCVRYT